MFRITKWLVGTFILCMLTSCKTTKNTVASLNGEWRIETVNKIGRAHV